MAIQLSSNTSSGAVIEDTSPDLQAGQVRVLEKVPEAMRIKFLGCSVVPSLSTCPAEGSRFEYATQVAILNVLIKLMGALKEN